MLPTSWLGPDPKGRLILLAIVLVIAFVLSGGIAAALLTVKREAMERSALVGWYACGDGQTIRHVPARRRGYRIACIDRGGAEIGGPNNGAMLRLMVPFALLIAVPGCWLALRVRLRRTRG